MKVDASCTTRWPRTLSAGFARALTVAVSTAAIVGRGSSGTGVGELLEGGGDCGHARGERLLAALAEASSGRSVKPSSSCQRPARRRRARAAAGRAPPPGDGCARSGLTRPGRARARARSRSCPRVRAAVPRSRPGRRGPTASRPRRADRAGATPPRPRSRRRLRCRRGVVEHEDAGSRPTPPRRAGRPGRAGTSRRRARASAEGKMVIRGAVGERRREHDRLRPRRGRRGPLRDRGRDQRIRAGGG